MAATACPRDSWKHTSRRTAVTGTDRAPSFDEVHYMRDKERGVVWEETIILLPHKVLGLVRSVCMSVVTVARMGGVATIRLDVGTRCAKQSRAAEHRRFSCWCISPIASY